MMLQSTRRVKAWSAAALAVALLAVAASPAGAQAAAGAGESISPAYEGWEQNQDGSYNLVFGYMNRNWDKLDISVGPDNRIEPGGPDQGQPTHFLPRRNRIIFRIQVPADFDDGEVVWTLTANGKTESAYATLHQDYYLNDIAIMNNNGAGGGGGGAYNIFGNRRPTLDVVGGARRSATAGEPVALTARASDDGVPKRRAVRAPVLGNPSADLRGTPDSASGLRLVWFVYRGPGEGVTFDPPQYDVWENYRGGANSPWAPGWDPPLVPPGGKWVVNATFDEPGTYVLRAQAHDGGLETNRDVTVTVSEASE